MTANDINSRRSFLKKVMAGVAGGVLPLTAVTQSSAAEDSTSDKQQRIKLGICSYSYWHFASELTPIEYVIEEASRIGVQGVDVLHRQMESEGASYIRSLKRHALKHGVSLLCLSTHQNFVDPDPEVRQQSIDDTIRFIRLAHDLGIPVIRISAGRWGTVDNFSELMEREGEEPPIEGYTEEDAFQWCIDSINKCIPTAEAHGITLGLENHWGMTRTAEGLLRIVRAVDSPWLGVLMDTGNFLDRRYEQLEMIAPYTVFVQAKTYYGGGLFYTLDIDYDRVAQILADVNYKGYIAVEFEGEEESATAVEKSVAMLRENFASHI